jgi:hypothetical protein
MGILILASKDVHRDSGCSFFISKLGDWWFYQQTHGCSRIDQAFNLIHQRLADACSEEFFEIEATESCPFNMPWHLDMKSPGCSGNLFTRFCVCLLSDWIMSGRTHTHIFNICQGWNCYFNLFHIWVIPVDFRSLFVRASLSGDLPKTYQSDFLHYCWYFWS